MKHDCSNVVKAKGKSISAHCRSSLVLQDIWIIIFSVMLFHCCPVAHKVYFLSFCFPFPILLPGIRIALSNFNRSCVTCSQYLSLLQCCVRAQHRHSENLVCRAPLWGNTDQYSLHKTLTFLMIRAAKPEHHG